MSRMMRMFVGCAVAASLLGTLARGDDGKVPSVDDYEIDPEDLVVLWLCASDCNEDQPPTPDNPMCFSYGLEIPGRWLIHMQSNIYHDYLMGYRRFMLHLPFGSEYENTSMDLDQPLDTIEAGFTHSVVGFFEALGWAEEFMPDAQFIVYLGSSESDQKYALDNDDRYVDHWLRMSAGGYNINLINYPNVAVAFDAGVRYQNAPGATWEAVDPYLQFIKLIESYKTRQGQLTYIEAIPRNEHTHGVSDGSVYEWQRTMPWIAMENAYQRQHDRWHDHDPPLESPESIRVMARQLDRKHWDNRGGPWAWAVDCMYKGHTIAIDRSSGAFPWEGLTAQQVADQINSRAAVWTPAPTPPPPPPAGDDHPADPSDTPHPDEHDARGGVDAQNVGT